MQAAMPYIVIRTDIIDHGMNTLTKLGADHICKVCIRNGGSCCRGCSSLTDGLGCQNRNTSCTSWLCGYLKLLLHQADLLEQWNDFWNEVPGMDYRQDFTPPLVTMTKYLELPSMQLLGEALAADLQRKLTRDQDNLDFIILASELDELIDELTTTDNPALIPLLQTRLHQLTTELHEFHAALFSYSTEQKQKNVSQGS